MTRLIPSLVSDSFSSRPQSGLTSSYRLPTSTSTSGKTLKMPSAFFHESSSRSSETQLPRYERPSQKRFPWPTLYPPVCCPTSIYIESTPCCEGNARSIHELSNYGETLPPGYEDATRRRMTREAFQAGKTQTMAHCVRLLH